MATKAYLHHGTGTAGPFCTESVPVKSVGENRWHVLFESRWRRVYQKGRQQFMDFQGQAIHVQIVEA